MFNAPDWDIGISLVMASFTFLTAEWTLRVFMERNWKLMLPAVLAAWWAADGCYIAYWSIVNPKALDMRGVALPVNVLLYLLCAVIWTALGRVDLHLRERAAARGHL